MNPFGRSFPVAPVPPARSERLIITASDDEIVVYDEERHQMHHLNLTAAEIWRLCDGRSSVNDLSLAATASLGFAVDGSIVRLALTKLEDASLLDAPLGDGVRLEGTTRRGFMKRVASTGAAILPVIVSVSAPKAAAAASGCQPNGAECWSDDACCQKWCVRDDFRFAGTCR